METQCELYNFTQWQTERKQYHATIIDLNSEKERLIAATTDLEQ
jgi:hypothetical protein